MQFTAAVIPPDVEIQKYLTSLHIDEWLREDVFRFKWWALLVMLLTAFILWWKLSDKARIIEICVYTTLSIVIFLGIFEYGEELALWEYPVDIIAMFPPLSSINLLCFPLVYSLIYQHFGTWKTFMAATLVVTAALCFIIEPLLSAAGFYELVRWKFYYSYPIYVAAAAGIRFMVVKFYSIMGKFTNKI